MALEWKRFTSLMEAQETLADVAGLEILRIGQTQELWEEYSGVAWATAAA